jgi:hypothetical protein
VTGSESLYIDGKVDGAINRPSGRVMVGRYAKVSHQCLRWCLFRGKSTSAGGQAKDD